MYFPKAIIVVLNWNGKNDTVECMESLRHVTYPNYEILLVDNGSVDGSAQLFMEKYPDVETIVNGKNLGYAEGNNVGIRRAIEKGAAYILLLNNDTVVDPGFLGEMITVMESDPDIGFAGPKVYYYDFNGRKDVISYAGGKISLLRGRSHRTGWKQVDTGQYDKIREVDFVCGSSILARKEAVDRIGLLDASYFTYWEETDWCLRGLEAGLKAMYVPKARIWHKIGASGTNKSYTYYMTRNTFWFIKKHAGGRKYLLFLCYYFLVEFWLISGYILVNKKDPARFPSFFKGIFDGVMTARA